MWVLGKRRGESGEAQTFPSHSLNDDDSMGKIRRCHKRESSPQPSQMRYRRGRRHSEPFTPALPIPVPGSGAGGGGSGGGGSGGSGGSGSGGSGGGYFRTRKKSINWPLRSLWSQSPKETAEHEEEVNEARLALAALVAEKLKKEREAAQMRERKAFLRVLKVTANVGST